MPYIPSKDRPQYIPMIEQEAKLINQSPDYRSARLGWVILTLLDKVFGDNAKRRYADHAEVDSVLSCAHKEYHRMFTKKCKVVEKTHTPEFWTVQAEDAIPELMETIDWHAAHIPEDKMLRGGHLNFSISMLIHLVYGDVEKRTPSIHGEVEMVLQHCADKYYNEFTAPYEDMKIGIEGDLDGKMIIDSGEEPKDEVKY